MDSKNLILSEITPQTAEHNKILNDLSLSVLFKKLPSTTIKEYLTQVIIEVPYKGKNHRDIKTKVENGILYIYEELPHFKDGFIKAIDNLIHPHFSRSFKLPPNINVDAIKSYLEDGVLYLVLPKTEMTTY